MGRLRAPYAYHGDGMRLVHAKQSNLAIVPRPPDPIFCRCEKGWAIRADPVARSEGPGPMKTMIAKLRAQAAKRAAYRRIRDEIARMPRAIALDIGIFPEDAERIALKAVWG